MDNLACCSEIAALIKEEQLLNGQKQVSEPLKQLVNFIIKVIECDIKKKSEFEAPDTSVVKNLEWFPTRPIIRKWVLYEIDRIHCTQSEKQYQHDSPCEIKLTVPPNIRDESQEPDQWNWQKKKRKKSLLKVKLPAS